MTNKEEMEFMVTSEVGVRFFTREKKEDSISDKIKIIIRSTTQYSQGIVCEILICLSQKTRVSESSHWSQREGRAGGRTQGEVEKATITDQERRWRIDLYTSALGAERSGCKRNT